MIESEDGPEVLDAGTIDSDLSSEDAGHLEVARGLSKSSPDHVVALAVISAAVAVAGIISTTLMALISARGR